MTIPGGDLDAHLTANAASDAPLKVGEQFWFVVAAPGDFKKNDDNTYDFTQRHVEAIFPQATPATHASKDLFYSRNTLEVGWCEEMLKAVLDAGLPRRKYIDLGEAISTYVVHARKLAMLSPDLFTMTSERLHTLPLGGGVQLHDDQKWEENMRIEELIDSGGFASGFASFSIIPQRWTLAERADGTLHSSIAKHLLCSAKAIDLPASVQSATVAKFVTERTPPLDRRRFASIAGCFTAVLQLSKDGGERFKDEFISSWRRAYPHLCLMCDATCLGEEAWSITGRMLKTDPTAAATAALDLSVKTWLPQLESAEFRDSSADARSAEMGRILRDQAGGGAGQRGSTARHEHEATAAADWVRVVAERPACREMLAQLELYHTIPPRLVDAAELMVKSPEAAGMLIVHGARVNVRMLREMSGVKSHDIWLELLQKKVCVDAEGVAQPMWYADIKLATAVKLFSGKWTIGPAGGKDTINPFVEWILPVLRRRDGRHLYTGSELDTPESLFQNEGRLRAAEVLLAAPFDMLGCASRAPGSLLSIIAAVKERLPKIEALPSARCAKAMGVLRVLLDKAVSKGFAGAAAAWSRMLATPMEVVKRPERFVGDAFPVINGHLDEFDKVLVQLQEQLNLADLLGGAPEAMVADLSAPAGTARSALQPPAGAADWGSRVPTRHGNGYYFGSTWQGLADGLDVDSLHCRACLAPSLSTAHLWCDKGPGCNHIRPSWAVLAPRQPVAAAVNFGRNPPQQREGVAPKVSAPAGRPPPHQPPHHQYQQQQQQFTEMADKRRKQSRQSVQQPPRQQHAQPSPGSILPPWRAAPLEPSPLGPLAHLPPPPPRGMKGKGAAGAGKGRGRGGAAGRGGARGGGGSARLRGGGAGGKGAGGKPLFRGRK